MKHPKFEDVLYDVFLKNLRFDKKNARYHAKRVVDSFERAVEDELEKEILNIINSDDVRFKTVSKKEETASYYEEDRYYGETVHSVYHLEFPDVVKIVRKIKPSLNSIMEHVDDTWSELEMDRQPEIIEAISLFLAAYVADVTGPEHGRLNDLARDHVYQEMFVEKDDESSDMEGHMKVNIGPACWTFKHVEGMTCIVEIEFGAGVEVLWPCDLDYHLYY